MWAININATIINSSTAPIDCETCTVSKGPLFLQSTAWENFLAMGLYIVITHVM